MERGRVNRRGVHQELEREAAGFFREVVEARRSVRRFTDAPVPEVVVRECLRLALLSANSSNLQPWEFHWVRTPALRARLVKACLDQKAAATAAELIVVVARTDTWRRNARRVLAQWPGGEPPDILQTYYKRLVPLMYGQGPLGVGGMLKRAVVTVLGLFRPVMREPCSKAELRTWAVKSTALGAQTLMLAFQAYGFDTCPMEGMDSRRVRKLLGLGRRAVVVMVLAVGVGAPEGIYHERVRLEAERFLFEH